MQSRGLNIEDAQDRRLWRICTGRRHQLYIPRIYIQLCPLIVVHIIASRQ
jgi:hypothetical protein